VTTLNIPSYGNKFEIDTYKRPKDLKDLLKTHVPFSGTPQMHPFDPKKVILISDPYSTYKFYYEFRADDISYLEELPSVVSYEGQTIIMVRIWVKKKSLALRCTPFLVEDTRTASL
jgi:inorganic pyrophosphatase